MDLIKVIRQVTENQDLTEDDAYHSAISIMEGEATDAQIAGLLIALRFKGETISEIKGFARAMREKATPIPCGIDRKCLVDTCGTGGDGSGTFNISTVSALVAAGAGCIVAKHGNRSVSSQCGSADVLAELGIRIDLTPEQIGKCIDGAGIGFLFAPKLHLAMKFAIGPRREIGVRTLFNILGPLTNPAGAERQVMGVFGRNLTEPLAHVLGKLGSSHVMVVHGEDGLDEITITGRTFVSELKEGSVSSYTIHPEELGVKVADLTSIQGGSPERNAQVASNILNGQTGPIRDIVLMNAGAVIYVSGLAPSMPEGIELARMSIDSGKALAKLEMLKTMSVE